MKVGFEIKKLILSWQLKLYDGIVRTGRKISTQLSKFNQHQDELV